MSHTTKAPLIIVSLVIFLAAGGVFAYLAWSKPQPAPEATTGDCRTVNEVTDCVQNYIGLSEEEGMERAKANGFAYRTVERNGELLPQTTDFSDTRLNFTVTDNRISKVEFY